MSLLSLPVSTLGVPRIGPRRELKAALESYWSGKSDAANLLESAAGLRAANWARQHALGVTNIPSNDFSLYDHVLDTSVMVGAISEICGWTGGPVPLDYQKHRVKKLKKRNKTSQDCFRTVDAHG